MNEKIAVIGGDARLTHLAEMFAKDGNNVYVFGQEKCLKTFEEQKKNSIFTKNDITICSSIENALNNAEIVISSVPFSKDGVNIYAPFSASKIEINYFLEIIKNKTFFAGSISNEVIKELKEKNVKVIDLMKQEDLTILNTIATAEGTISEIILNTKTNIHGSKILILGFGRVAKVLAKKLLGLNASVTCAARKDADFAWMEALSFAKTNINKLGENLKKYDIIINTVPQLILDENRLKNVKQESLLIDLASKPGGIDTKACEKLGLKCIWALAIPGKVAPITSAKYIKETIEKHIKKGVDN